MLVAIVCSELCAPSLLSTAVREASLSLLESLELDGMILSESVVSKEIEGVGVGRRDAMDSDRSVVARAADVSSYMKSS